MKTIGIIFTFLIFAYLFFLNEKPTNKIENKIDIEKIVEVTTLNKEIFTKVLKFSGFSEASRIVTIKSQVEGKVSSKFFQKGLFYKAGSQLVLIDPEDKIAKVKEMEALLEQRKKEFEVAEKLYKKGFRSEVKLSESRTYFEKALALYEKSQVELNNTKILVPFDSSIEESYVELGDYVKKGDNIAKIVDLDPIFITLNTTEKEIQNLSLNQKAKVIISNNEYKGMINYISKTSDKLTRNFKIQVKIDNKENKIISGLSSEVQISLPNKKAYFIASSLISLDNQGKIGIKAVKNNKVFFLTIDILSDVGNGFWVNSNQDVNFEDFKIISQGHEYVISGEEVKIKYND